MSQNSVQKITGIKTWVEVNPRKYESPDVIKPEAEPFEEEHPNTSKLGESSEKPKGASEAFKSKDDYADTNSVLQIENLLVNEFGFNNYEVTTIFTENV